MVLAYFQNHSSKYKEQNPNVPDIYKFIEFYSNLDEAEYGLQIDLREIFPDDPFYAQKAEDKYPRIIPVDFRVHKNINNDTCEPLLYIKDPIGKIFYSDPSDHHLFRENIAQSAFNYQRVKSHFKQSYERLNS